MRKWFYRKNQSLGFGLWHRVTAHTSLSPPEPITDPAHGEGGDHATDGEHGHGQGPVHGEDVWGGSEVLTDVIWGWQCALCASLEEGAILPRGIGGISVWGENAQHTPVVRFYHL